MNVTGLITGLVMLFAPVEEVNITSKIYQGVVLTGKVIEKTEEGTWGASAHEEGYQITKDTILEIGGIK
jgi:predicted nucleic acid-binding protein